MYEKLRLGVSPLTKEVFLGRTKKKKPGKNYYEWCSGKRNITDNFIQCVLEKYKPGTTTILSSGGKPLFKITVENIEE